MKVKLFHFVFMLSPGAIAPTENTQTLTGKQTTLKSAVEKKTNKINEKAHKNRYNKVNQRTRLPCTMHKTILNDAVQQQPRSYPLTHFFFICSLRMDTKTTMTTKKSSKNNNNNNIIDVVYHFYSLCMVSSMTQSTTTICTYVRSLAVSSNNPKHMHKQSDNSTYKPQYNSSRSDHLSFFRFSLHIHFLVVDSKTIRGVSSFCYIKYRHICTLSM